MKTPQEYINNNLHSLEGGVNTVDLLNLIEEVQKDSWNEAINKVADNCEEYSAVNEIGEATDTICFIEKEDILELLKP